jgi:hypothetical protein
LGVLISLHPCQSLLVFILLIYSLLIPGIPVDMMLYLIVLLLCITCVNGHFYIFLPKWSLKAFVHFKLGLFVSLQLELYNNVIHSAYCTLIRHVICNYLPYAATFFYFLFFCMKTFNFNKLQYIYFSLLLMICGTHWRI